MQYRGHDKCISTEQNVGLFDFSNYRRHSCCDKQHRQSSTPDGKLLLRSHRAEIGPPLLDRVEAVRPSQTYQE